ncbi:hypothetical protein BDD12DRAFT_800830 [Trichophaea hybrida]|nr:hypothetical protein BDD12DRAFT_800830 [Trichophaea hybrida]
MRLAVFREHIIRVMLLNWPDVYLIRWKLLLDWTMDILDIYIHKPQPVIRQKRHAYRKARYEMIRFTGHNKTTPGAEYTSGRNLRKLTTRTTPHRANEDRSSTDNPDKNGHNKDGAGKDGAGKDGAGKDGPGNSYIKNVLLGLSSVGVFDVCYAYCYDHNRARQIRKSFEERKDTFLSPPDFLVRLEAM